MRNAAVLVLALALALGCAQTVRVESSPALLGRQLSVTRAAMTAFAAAPYVGDGELRADATTLVTRYVSEALSARGIAVIPAPDVALVLPEGEIDPHAAASAVHAEFGADALLLGSVVRFRERRGEALGVQSPTSVIFAVKLYSAPGGALLWTGTFEETQQALTANVLKTARYPGRGTRWLTVEEFARWGAEEVVGSMPLGH